MRRRVLGSASESGVASWVSANNSDVLAYYPMNDAAASGTMLDQSGNGRNGTYQSGVAAGTLDSGLTCMDLDGTSTSFASVADAAWMDTIVGGFCVVNYDSTTGMAMARYQTASSNEPFQMSRLGTGHVYFTTDASTNFVEGGSEAGNIPLTTDTTLGWWWDGTRVHVYVNGIKCASILEAGPAAAACALSFGCRVPTGTPEVLMNGRIGEAVLLGTMDANSIPDLHAAYTSADSPPTDYPTIVAADSPTTYHELDEATGNFVDVISGFDAVEVGSVTRSATALIDTGAAIVTSSTNYATFPSTGIGGGSMSWEAWFSCTNAAQLGALVFRRDTSNRLDGIFVGTTGFASSKQITAAVYFGTSSNRRLWTTVSDVVDGNAHHVVAVFDGSLAGDTKMRIYIDGVEVSTSVTYSVGTAPTAVFDSSGTQNYYIGSSSFGTGVMDFAGTIDEVAVYERILTCGEIMDHYLAGTN